MSTPTAPIPASSLSEMTKEPSAPDPPETKSQAEALLPLFQPSRLLRQTDHSRTLTLLGTINTTPALLILERAALPCDLQTLSNLMSTLSSPTNLGANDIYRWYMANTLIPSHPNLKVNLIWPATERHIAKYETQRVRWVTETSEVYVQHVKPWIARTQTGKERLGWIWNVLDGITEQEDVVYRSAGMGVFQREDRGDSTGFLLLPDLNWDRKGVEGLHLLAIVERRDLWSLRGLKGRDVAWLRGLRNEAVRAAAGVAGRLFRDAAAEASNGTNGTDDGSEASVDVDEDQFKCYVHYQPTYYHFHVHVVHCMLEAGATQAVGKAFSLDLLIEMLERIGSENGDGERGLEELSLGYTVGEQSELWKKLFLPLKKGERVTLNDE